MFDLFKAKHPYAQEARFIYAALLERARHPVFYQAYGVADTFEGRFDCLLVHVFTVVHVMLNHPNGEAFNQALFDIMFADMDQALREGGKGDVGVLKQMRYMMKAFNGRMNAYEEALGNDAALEEALQRNLYAGAQGAPVKKMSQYLQEVVLFIKEQSADDILSGQLQFKAIDKKAIHEEDNA